MRRQPDDTILISPVTLRPLGSRWSHGIFAALALSSAGLSLVGYWTLGLGPAWIASSARVVPPLTSAISRVAVPPVIQSLARLPGLPGSEHDKRLPALPVADAVSRNNAIPFAAAPLKVAPAFHFTGSMQDRERAVDCLALAAMAEAGGSNAGQRAVMQVVLNRVRHPAFAKSVCGVVFQGADRATGCQFTFTCDGSLSRRYSEAGWAAARRRAAEALDGKVFAKVGTATHYHTDWVFPYWSTSLDKIARVDTHLFFRWKGYWGTPASFRMGYRGGERAMTDLVSRAQTGAASNPVPNVRATSTTSQAAPFGGAVVKHPDGGAYLVSYGARPNAADALANARRLCGGTGYCRVMGWADRSAMPRGFPVPPGARAMLSFSYVLDAQNNEIVLYDCRTFVGIARDKCIPAPSRPT